MADLVNPFTKPTPSGGLINPFAKPKENKKTDALLPTINISETMYDDLETMEEAEARYNEIIRSPDVQTTFGATAEELEAEGENPAAGWIRYIYTDPNTGERNIVLEPDRNMFGFGSKPTVGFSQMLGRGIEESVGDAVEFGAAVSDKYFGTDVQKDVQDQTYGIKTDTFTGALVADGLPALGAAFIPGSAVYKGTKAVSEGLKNAPKIVQFFGNMLRGTAMAIPGEIAATATVGTEEGNFLFGDDSIFKGMAELGDTEADQLLEQRLNAFTEALVAGGVLSTGMRLAGGATKLTKDLIVSPLIVAISPGDAALEKAVYQEVARRLTNIGPTATDDEVAAAIAEATEIIRENKEVMVTDFRKLAEDRTLNIEQSQTPIKRDTVSALTAGLDSNVDEAAIANAQGVRAGVVSSGEGGKILETMNAPVKKAIKGVEAERATLAEGASEKEVLTGAAQGFTEIGRNQLDSAVGGFSNAREAFEASAQNSLEGVQDDLGFIQAIERLETSVGTDIVEPKTAAFTDIVQALEDNYAQMVTTKNQLYAAVRGGEIDAAQVYKLFSRMPAEDVSKASLAFSKNDNFLAQIQPRRIQVEEEGELITRLETEEEVMDRFEDWLTQNNADFGFFYTKIRPEFAKLASAAFDNNDPLLGGYYRDVVNFIDEDMLKHVENNNPELAEAAAEAKDYYKGTFARIWRDNDAMQQFSNIYDSTLGRTPADDLTSMVTRDEPFRPGFDAKAEDFTKGILQSGNMARTVNLANALPGAEDAGRIADYYILDTVNAFANSIRTRGMDQTDFSNFSERLMQYSEQLNALAKSSPEMADKVDSINRFIMRIEAAGGDQAQVEKILAAAQAQSQELMKQVENSVVGKFFDAEQTPGIVDLLRGAEIPATSDPEGAFRAIFTAKTQGKNEAPNRVGRLLSLIAQQPEANRPILMRGLKLSYNRLLDEKSFTLMRSAGDVRDAKAGEITRALGDITPLFEVGDIIYADQPQFMEAVRGTLAAAAEATQGKTATPIRSQSATAFNQQAATATTRLIYLVVGPLSRGGSRIRAVVGSAIENADADTKARGILENILADPDYFLELADKYNRSPSDPLLNDLMIDYLSSAIVKASADNDEEGMLGDMQDQLRSASEAAINTVK